MLVENGLFPDVATTIINLYIKEKQNEVLIKTWDDYISGYPPMLVSVIWLGVKSFTAKWLGENQPENWCRPMFDDVLMQTVLDMQNSKSTLLGV